MLPEGTAVQPGAVRITDGADVGRVGLVGVVVDEPIENIEQLEHLGWQLAVEQAEKGGEMAKRKEQAGLTAEQLAEIRESVDDITGYLPATVVVLLDEVERLQSELRQVAQMVHQAYHQEEPGTWRECHKGVCVRVQCTLPVEASDD